VAGKFSEEDDVDQRVEPQSWVTEEAEADSGSSADTPYTGDPQPVLATDLPSDAGGLSSSPSSSSSSSSSLPTTAPGVIPPALPSSGLTPSSFGSDSSSGYSPGSDYGPGSSFSSDYDSGSSFSSSYDPGPSSSYSPASSYSPGSAYGSGSSYGSGAGSDPGSGSGEGAATVSSPVPPPYPAQINSDKPKSPASPFSVLNKASKPPKAPKAPKPPKPQKPARQPRIKAETRPSLNGAAPAAPARRAHLAVIRLEPWSVMKFSFMISLVGWVVLFVMVAALWWVLSKIGVFHSIEGSVSNLTSGKDSTGVSASNWFSASRVLGYTMLVGAVNVILITALATIGSVVYNLVTHIAGGIEVTLKETD
jgi:hypothetical protein